MRAWRGHLKDRSCPTGMIEDHRASFNLVRRDLQRRRRMSGIPVDRLRLFLEYIGDSARQPRVFCPRMTLLLLQVVLEVCGTGLAELHRPRVSAPAQLRHSHHGRLWLLVLAEGCPYRKPSCRLLGTARPCRGSCRFSPQVAGIHLGSVSNKHKFLSELQRVITSSQLDGCLFVCTGCYPGLPVVTARPAIAWHGWPRP